MTRKHRPANATDLFELEIMRGRLQSIVDEAGAVLMRTAFSPIIREANDFACAILTPDGRSVAQSSQSIPVFLGTMTHTAQQFLQLFPLETWQPGDVVATNDPWLGTGHLYDITVMRAIFVDDAIAGFAGVVAHLLDIGGRPFAVDSEDVFEEGLRLPPLKIVRAGGELESIVRQIIEANVRMPDFVLGDIEAVLNAASVIARDVARICEETTVTAFEHTWRELEARSEEYMREAIKALPDGTGAAVVDGETVAGNPVRIRARVTVEGDRISVDYDGSSDQVPAAINSVFAYTKAYTVYALKCALAPSLPFNEGIVRPIEVEAPAATVVNSMFPAAGAVRNLVGHFIPTLVFNALAAISPEHAIAECGAPRPIVNISGVHDGTPFVMTILVMGGFGARRGRDGLACVAFPTNTRTVPVEIVESAAPLLIDEKHLLAGSGGAGEFRGGLGQRITVRCLAERAHASIIAQRLRHPPQGVFGGAQGSRTRIELNGRELDDVSERIALSLNDVLTVESSGGGGFGTPGRRSNAAVESDVRNGYISEEAARAEYGEAART